MLVMGSAGKNNIYRYNVSKNDGNGSELFYCGAKDTFIYNNTIYIGEGITLPYLIEDGNATQMKFINNCFYPASILELPGGPTEGTTIGTITENPMLKNPRGEDIVMDTWTESIWHANLEKFTLKEGSPCIDAGVVITNDGGRDNGGKDIYENKLYIGRPNIGAFELNAPLGAISTNDVFIASEDAYVRDVPHAYKILVVQ